MNRPLKVLVVEDNIQVQRAIEAMLSLDKNLTVDTAGSMAQAETRLTTSTYNVILLDLMLPDAKDLEGLVRLTTNYPKTPIVVLSGLGKEMEISALQKGAEDFIEKPPTSAQSLISSVRHAAIRHEVSKEFASLHESLAATGEALKSYEEHIKKQD